MSLIKKIILIIAVVIGIMILVPIINAAKYKMVVQVVDREDVFGINPLADNLDFGDLSRNGGMTRFVDLKNNGKLNIYFVVWKFGEISDLVKTDKNFFTLKPGEETKIAFEIKIPPSAEAKKYKGGVWIFRVPKVF